MLKNTLMPCMQQFPLRKCVAWIKPYINKVCSHNSISSKYTPVDIIIMDNILYDSSALFPRVPIVFDQWFAITKSTPK